MYGGPAIGRAQSPGGFIGDPCAHAMSEETERHGHQWLDDVMQLLHKRGHRGEWELVKARGAARQFQRTEIDFRRHKAPQWPIKRGISRGMRKAEQATANDSAFIAKWSPPVEHDSVPRNPASSLSNNGAV